MRIFNQLLISFTLASMSACQFNPAPPIQMPTDAEVEQYNASASPEERIVCREEIPVTTHIPRKICRLAADMQEDSAFTRSELIRAIR
jgi:hypothetical protein